MIEFFTLVIFLLYFILLFKWLYDYLNLFQQSYYKIKRMNDHHLNYYIKKIIFIYLVLLSFLLEKNLFLIISFTIVMYYFITIRKSIVHLKLTKRMIRLLVTTSILFLIINLLIGLISFNNILIYPVISLFILPLVVQSANILNQPIEKLINRHFINNAKRILSQNPNLIKIAITGSYGKTTTKNILYQVLKKQYLTVMTPKSYNTLLGVVKTINSKIDATTEIFIVEMGAAEVGDIAEIMDVLHPQIGILTDIGPQHLSTFKTMENIINTKFELVDYLTYNDLIILNYDNEYIKNRKIINVNKIITTSTLSQDAIYTVKDIKITPYQCFDIYEKGVKIMEIETKLFGRHNIQNIVQSICALRSLNQFGMKVDLDKAYFAIKEMQAVPHRLEYRRLENIHLYDDAYNSNFMGMKNAIEVLSATNHKKVIITPGLVELGQMSDELNLQIAIKIQEVFDDIYIINNKASRIIIDYLNHNTNKYHVCYSFKEAYDIVKNKYLEEEIDLLLANDLPDHYLER